MVLFQFDIKCIQSNTLAMKSRDKDDGRWRKRSTPPTCTKGFGHQPCEACSDFCSIKIIMIKRLDGRNNESLFRVPGVGQISHIHSGSVTSSTHNDDISPKEFNASKLTFCFLSLTYTLDFVTYMCHSAVKTLGWAYFHIKFGNKSGVLPIELHPFWYPI